MAARQDAKKHASRGRFDNTLNCEYLTLEYHICLTLKALLDVVQGCFETPLEPGCLRRSENSQNCGKNVNV